MRENIFTGLGWNVRGISLRLAKEREKEGGRALQSEKGGREGNGEEELRETKGEREWYFWLYLSLPLSLSLSL